MTVKSLHSIQKDWIAHDFKTGVMTIDQLALAYESSRRTIIRVLEEQGCAPPVKKRNRKSKEVLVITQEPVEIQIPVVIPTKTPWWKKVLNWLGTPMWEENRA